MIKNIIACPDCHNRFRIPADAIGAAGRKVRCSACSHTWFAERRDLLDSEPLGDKEADQNLLQDKSATDSKAIGNDVAKNVSEAKDDLPLQDDASDTDDKEETIPHIESLFAEDKTTQKRSAAQQLSTTRAAQRYTQQRQILVVANSICAAIAVLFTLLLYRDTVLSHIPAAAPLYAAIGYEATQGIGISDVRFDSTIDNGVKTYQLRGMIANQTDLIRHIPRLRVRLMREDGSILQEGEQATDMTLDPGKAEHFDLNIQTEASVNASVLSLELGSPMELMLRN